MEAALRERRWAEEDQEKRRKTDAGNMEMAAGLGAKTMMTLEWIAGRLQMGCSHTVPIA